MWLEVEGGCGLRTSVLRDISDPRQGLVATLLNDLQIPNLNTHTVEQSTKVSD